MQQHSYLGLANYPVLSIVKGVDHDVEHGEDILMLGYGAVLMAPFFAPIAPPNILLPLMALSFVLSVYFSHRNFQRIQRKLATATTMLESQDLSILRPITDIVKEHSQQSLTESFNPLKNPMRTAKSFLGGILINPFWVPIFYTLGMQFVEDNQVCLLNKAVITVEDKIKYCQSKNLRE
jgi:hypothetical protein